MISPPPISLPDLKFRFSPIFKKLRTSNVCTLLGLPHTGQSSHLRYISSQADLLIKFAFPPEYRFIWSETGNCQTVSSFLSEICLNLDHSIISDPAFIYQDEYLLFTLLRRIISSSPVSLLLVITLTSTQTQLSSAIENYFTLLQKQNRSLKIIYSLDLAVVNHHTSGHQSTPMFENIFYFPTFSLSETRYAIKNVASRHHKRVSGQFINQAHDLTGGIAGLFHPFIYQGDSCLKSPQTAEYIELLIREILTNPQQANYLTTLQSRKFLSGFSSSSFSFGPVKLKTSPSSQEINLLRFLLDRINLPVSRDEIASVIWGKLSTSKYSDWAIDKAVSRLRQNIMSPNYRLTTVKNLGYSLICVPNSITG